LFLAFRVGFFFFSHDLLFSNDYLLIARCIV